MVLLNLASGDRHIYRVILRSRSSDEMEVPNDEHALISRLTCHKAKLTLHCRPSSVIAAIAR